MGADRTTLNGQKVFNIRCIETINLSLIELGLCAGRKTIHEGRLIFKINRGGAIFGVLVIHQVYRK